jgi:hypothetical protein
MPETARTTGSHDSTTFAGKRVRDRSGREVQIRGYWVFDEIAWDCGFTRSNRRNQGSRNIGQEIRGILDHAFPAACILPQQICIFPALPTLNKIPSNSAY